MGGRTAISDDEDEIKEEEDVREEEKEGVDIDLSDDDDGEEDEEEEGQDEYEKDGFIVDGVKDEEEEEKKDDNHDDRHRKKKKRRETEKNYEIDEDDYELLEDNNITGFHRPKPGSKFKRLKKAGRDSEVEERSGFSDEEEYGRNGRGGQKTAEEKLNHSLFGAPLEDIAEEEEQSEEVEDGDIGEDDEMADFIVDEHGAVVKKKKIKKKKVRQVPGVSSSALQETHEIFGDVDELLMLHKQGIARASSDAGFGEKRLEDEFEPLILSERYMLPKDDAIREIDVPERIQDIIGWLPTDDESIDEESAWIHNQLLAAADTPHHDNLLAAGYIPPQIAEVWVVKDKEIDKEDIGRVLTMIHGHKYDLPFIAMYRKELCLSLLKDPVKFLPGVEKPPAIRWHKLLWTVYNLDRKWLLLRKRKNALQMYYSKHFDEEARRIDDETRLASNQQIFNSISGALKSANFEREVDDVNAKFNLHFPPGEFKVEEGQFKRPKRKSLYSICYKAGQWEVANKFGYSSEQFGSYLIKEKVSTELEDGKETPEEVAANFTCAMFETPADVLKGARHMAAVEIGCEPSVKKHVRRTYMNNAVVNTSPTPEGDLTIDAHHELAGVKWLCNKPLSKFVDAQWLRIQKAEEEKLLQVTIKLPQNIQDELLSDANENYISERVSKLAQLWNEQRKKILEDAFSNFLLPAMEKEARALLTARAKSWLLMEYGRHLWSKVSVAPYQKKVTNNDTEDESDLRVMACCWGPGKPATTFVMLDSAGEVVDVLYAGSINVRSQAVAERQRKQLDQERLLKFMTDHQPHVVCLGAVNLSCIPLKDDIYKIIFKMVEDYPRDVIQDMTVTVVFEDESLPRLYENSRISSDQLPAQPGIVKRCVGLGRYLQNPLAMIATLCGPGKEILSWKLCPLEHFLTDDEKYEMAEQIMVDATNQVGLDINLAASHEWLFAPLQFISGLGPRKASSLQRVVVRNGSILSRKKILDNPLKRKVFLNAIGFLRVHSGGAAASSGHIMDLLDDTRINPESYELAKNMAKDVHTEDLPNGVDEMDDDYDLEIAIELVRDRPQTLRGLDIDAYHTFYVGNDGSRKWETLYLIKMELLHGFQDWRVPFTYPTPDEEFSLLSGETEDSLSEGKLVQVAVRQVLANRIMCSFDFGLKGMINGEDFSDDGFDPEKVQEGEVLTCKIKTVNKQRFLVYLTCKASDLSIKPRFIRNLDFYYKEDDVNLYSEQEKARKEKELAKKHFKPRMIVHPCFQNLTADEAQQYLSDKNAGESIIHPSSKGSSFFTLTIKVYDGIYAHKDIVEWGKDYRDFTCLHRLRKTLTIDKERFEDLDEVMDRYVDPLVGHLKNMLNYHKFKRGTKKQVDELLIAEKAENPMSIVYCFGISHEHPGTFILSFIRSSNPHYEYIGLYPKGFRFWKKDFDDIDRLVAHFKKYIDYKPLLTVAAMVPMKSLAACVSSGEGSNNDGWRNSERGSSTPGSRSGGRPDHRNYYGGGDNRDNNPSGLPCLGRGRGGCGGWCGHSNNDFGSSNWGSGSSSSRNEDGGFSSFPGAKVQNSPGRERFTGSWGGGTWVSDDNNDGGVSSGGSGGSSPSWGGSGSDSGLVNSETGSSPS